MKRFTRNMIVAAVLLALAGIAPVRSQIVQPGPLDFSGEINGAPFRIVVPAVWNGTLVEFVRGYTDKADQPGEVDNRNPPSPRMPLSAMPSSPEATRLLAAPARTTAGRWRRDLTTSSRWPATSGRT
jgi:hypothetical protein